MNLLNLALLLGLLLETAALVLEFYRHRRDSVTSLLKQERERLQKRENQLLDRLMMLTTGAPLEIPKAAAEEMQPEKSAKLAEIKGKIQDVIDEPPLPTLHELMARAEAQSFLEDADLEPETEMSAMSRSEEEVTEEQQRAVKSMKKEFQTNFERARDEYLQRAKPVLTAQEKTN